MPEPSEPLTPALRAELLAALPVSARQLATVIGVESTIVVLRALGGRRVYVPERVQGKAFDRLESSIGSDAARALIVLRAGSVWDVPTINRIERLLRDRALRADHEAGMPAHDLVEKYDLTQRSIRRRLTVERG